MTAQTATTIKKVFSPAKINLYLHITGKRGDGYHELDSLVGFVDIGDELKFEPADKLSFKAEGPYGHLLKGGYNLVLKAIEAMGVGYGANFDITLTKNLPVAAGIGGGSSNAAAAIWALYDQGIIEDISSPELITKMAELGADIPVCLGCKTTRMQGIGEILSDVPTMPEISIVLANPNKPCSTQEVFANYGNDFTGPATDMPECFEDFNRLILFLTAQRNDLTSAAKRTVPEISNVLNQIEQQKGCVLSRLSGSGATCFGLFEHEADAEVASIELAEDNPDWWVRAGTLGRPERY